MRINNSTKRLAGLMILIAALAWVACGKNKEKDESTTSAQSTMPAVSLSCGNVSCIQ